MEYAGDFDFMPSVTKMVKEGEIVVREDARQGLKELPQLLLDVLKGANNGKAVINVADE